MSIFSEKENVTNFIIPVINTRLKISRYFQDGKDYYMSLYNYNARSLPNYNLDCIHYKFHVYVPANAYVLHPATLNRALD